MKTINQILIGFWNDSLFFRCRPFEVRLDPRSWTLLLRERDDDGSCIGQGHDGGLTWRNLPIIKEFGLPLWMTPVSRGGRMGEYITPHRCVTLACRESRPSGDGRIIYFNDRLGTDVEPEQEG